MIEGEAVGVASDVVKVQVSTQTKGLEGILLIEAPYRSMAMLPLSPDGDCGGGGIRPPHTRKYGGLGDDEPESFEEGEDPINEDLPPERDAVPLAEYFLSGYHMRWLDVPRER